MFKRLSVALAALFVLASSAIAAGTVPGFSLVPQFDKLGRVAPGCKLYVIAAGTVSTPQNAYQDSGLTLLQPNPLLCDSTGRLPQWFVADGNIKLRLTDRSGVELFVQDNLLVIGASSGGGGGGSVDPTTILATGDFKDVYNTGILTGFVRCNGRTIGSATSGGTERANADTSALFSFLWNADANLAVSGGRGASGAADFAANKTITLPDCRGRGRSALADMGNTDSGRISTTYFGCTGLVLGCVGGSESTVLLTANLPPYTPTTASVTGGAASFAFTSNGNYATGGATTAVSGITSSGGGTTVATTFTQPTVVMNAQGGTSTPHRTVQPTILVTTYIKL